MIYAQPIKPFSSGRPAMVPNEMLLTSQQNSSWVQPKLSVGSIIDPLEKKADAMAEKVMQMETPGSINFSSPKNDINRKCTHCEEEEKQLQKKESSNHSISEAPSIVHEVINSSDGRSLDADTRSFMEPRFNYDFSNVKIHDNDLAAKSANSINAFAYTSGNNIVFNSGQYNKNSDSGKRLLAHELTHVVQQQGIQKKVQRDIDPAFRIEGLYDERASVKNFVFFDIKKPDNEITPEDDLDPDEKKKIGIFASTHKKGIKLFGFSSEEGIEASNKSLVDLRIHAVKNVLTSAPINYDAASIETQPLPVASKNQFDYRFWRTVEMEETGQASSRTQSATAAAKRGLDACSTDQTDKIIKPAREMAMKDMEKSVTAITAFRSDKATNKKTGDALIFAFHSDSDPTMQKVIDRLNAGKSFLDTMLTKMQCGNEQSVDCGANAAMTSPEGIIFCQPFLDASETTEGRSAMLVHESLHGSKFEINDRSYNWERVITLLTTRQALDNAESFSLFVEAIKTGKIPTVGPTDADKADTCGADADLAKSTVAWSERWNTYATTGLWQTYGQDVNTAFMAPHINFYFKRSDRAALAGILDRYTQMMSFFQAGAIKIDCVDRTDPLYKTWKIAEWDKSDRTVRISIEQLKRSYMNLDDKIKHVYGALVVDRFGAPEEHRMAYPNVARAYKLFFWDVWG